MPKPVAPQPEALALALAMAGHSIPLALARVLVALPPRDCIEFLDGIYGKDFCFELVRRMAAGNSISGERVH